MKRDISFFLLLFMAFFIVKKIIVGMLTKLKKIMDLLAWINMNKLKPSQRRAEKIFSSTKNCVFFLSCQLYKKTPFLMLLEKSLVLLIL